MCDFQIVDSFSETPEVLLDLNDAFGVAEGSSFAPPPPRRTNSWTSMADGSIEPETTWGDREITLTLDGTHGTAEGQVANLQKLGRLLSSPQWMKVKPCGMSHPVFFRTRRAETRIIEIFMTSDPQRGLEVTLPADPFAYGLPESGQVEISALAWSCHLPEAKGDVPAPLHLSFPTPLNEPFYATGRKYAVLASTFPGEIPLDDLPFSPPLDAGAGVANGTFVNDVTAQASRRLDITFGSAYASLTVPLSFNLSDPIPAASDFRVLARAKVTGAGPIRMQLIRDTLSGAILTEEVIRRSSSPGWEVFDLGVARLPAQSVDRDIFGLNTPPTAADPRLRVILDEGGSTSTTVSLDEVRLVPVSAGCRWCSTATRPRSFTAPSSGVRLTLDGVNDRRFFSWTSSGLARQVMAPGITGGLPIITPGPRNTLTIVPVAAMDPSISEGGELAHSMTGTLLVDYLYIPRYLYLRGAE